MIDKNLEFIALLSSVVGFVSVWPQYLKTANTHNTDSFCPKSVCLNIASTFIFLVYAYLKRLPVLCLSTIASLFWLGWLLYKIKTAPTT